MIEPFIQWQEELTSFDHASNHLEILEQIEITYLQSDAANERKTRIKAIWLLRHFKKLL